MNKKDKKIVETIAGIGLGAIAGMVVNKYAPQMDNSTAGRRTLIINGVKGGVGVATALSTKGHVQSFAIGLTIESALETAIQYGFSDNPDDFTGIPGISGTTRGSRLPGHLSVGERATIREGRRGRRAYSTRKGNTLNGLHGQTNARSIRY